MNVSWLIEKHVFEDNVDSLVKEIKNQGMDIKMVSYAPFESSKKYLSLFQKESCIVFYGSLQMASQIKKEATWVPGVYANFSQFECVAYYPVFGDFLLNNNYIMLPYGELIRRKDFLFDVLGNNGSVFVRPNSGLKTFTGKVANSETWEKDVEYFGFYDVTPNTLVVVSEPRNLLAEWRLVIVQNKIVSATQYHNDVGLKVSENVPQEVFNFAENVLSEVQYSPDRAWCMDVCQTKEGTFHVLEVGCFSCAGLYVAPKESIVREISRIALEEWKEYYELSQSS